VYDLEEKRQWNFKEEEIDRSLWRTRFGKGYVMNNAVEEGKQF